MPAWEEPLRQDCDGSHREVDRLLIRTAAGQAGIGNNDGRITCSAPAPSGASPIRGHTVITDTNPRRSPRPAAPDSQSDTRQSGAVWAILEAPVLATAAIARGDGRGRPGMSMTRRLVARLRAPLGERYGAPGQGHSTSRGASSPRFTLELRRMLDGRPFCRFMLDMDPPNVGCPPRDGRCSADRQAPIGTWRRTWARIVGCGGSRVQRARPAAGEDRWRRCNACGSEGTQLACPADRQPWASGEHRTSSRRAVAGFVSRARPPVAARPRRWRSQVTRAGPRWRGCGGAGGGAWLSPGGRSGSRGRRAVREARARGPYAARRRRCSGGSGHAAGGAGVVARRAAG